MHAGEKFLLHFLQSGHVPKKLTMDDHEPNHCLTTPFAAFSAFYTVGSMLALKKDRFDVKENS